MMATISIILLIITCVLWGIGMLSIRHDNQLTQGAKNRRWVLLGMFGMSFISFWISIIWAH